MTESKVESIWDTAWDTTRFNAINLRIAELLNIIFNSDATTNVTDTAVLPYFEQFSEELLLDLKLAAQANAITVPWDFIQAKVSSFFIEKYTRDRELIDHVLKILNKTESVELVSISGFGAASDL
jgi:hypothetical protein